ncbi:tetratricopeptide repeat protein [Actinoplanes sp. NBC_00393]
MAELHRERFPDGLIYLDLRGVDAMPMTAGEAQTRLLRALAVSPRQIAQDAGERTGQLRAVLRHRRCLIILDNAADEAQVRPLLPGGGGSLVLVTSRRALGGLEAVLRIGLAPFTVTESAELLRALAGPGSGTDEEVARVAYLCGHLPLALRIVGRPGGAMGRLAALLADADRRLSVLNGVEAAFEVSYRRLPAGARLLFRRAAHIVTGSFSVDAAAVLAGGDRHQAAARGDRHEAAAGGDRHEAAAGVDRREGAAGGDRYAAEDLCDHLVECGLLQPDGQDRYRLHDLLRLFAAARLRAEEPETTRARTEEALTTWYLETAIAAGRWFEPAYGQAPPTWAGRVPLDSAEQAQDWLQTELDGWHAALRKAAAAGEHQRVVDVAEALHWYSDRTFSTEPWTAVYELSQQAAAQLPDRRPEIVHRNYLAWAYAMCDRRYAESYQQAMLAHELAVEIGDVREQAAALAYGATALRRLDDFGRAYELYQRSLELSEAAGDHDAYVNTMVAVGLCHENQGRSAEAAEQYRRVLTELDRRPVAASPAQIARVTASIYLGRVLADAGRWAEALDAAEAARPLAEEYGETFLRGQAVLVLGWVCAATGDAERAQQLLRAASRLLNGSA